MKLFTVFIIISVSLFYFQCNSHSHKLSTEEATSRWVGGNDGGSWFYVKAIDKNGFKILIKDKNKSIEIEDVFTLNQECSFVELDSLRVINNIIGYDGQRILLNIQQADKYCYLEPRKKN